MGRKITEFDHALAKRLENVRKNENITQEKMAEHMGVTIESYKRYIYCKSQVPVEALVHLFSSYAVDQDYLLFGTEKNVMKLVGYVLGCSDVDKSDFFMTLARMYKKRNRPAAIDYQTEAGELIETGNRKPKKATTKKK